MKVLVTGGAGFIGSHVVDGLLEGGHGVAVVDDLSHGRRENVPDGVAFYREDVRGGCPGAMRDFGPEVVVHLAAQMDVGRSVAEPDFDAEVNVVGTVRLLQNCVRGGVRKFVFSSTGGAIYGEQDSFPATESHREFPVSPYGVSKLAGERYLNYFKKQHGLDSVSLRYANVYGPRQDPHGEGGVVAIFCNRLARGEGARINGDGEQTRDYVYGPDVARANVLAVENRVEPGAYNIGTGVETTVNRLYGLLLEGAGKDLPARYGPARPGETRRSCISPKLAGEMLGWRPETSLDDGLRRTLRYFGAV